MTLAENVSCAMQGAGLSATGPASNDLRAGVCHLVTSAPNLAANALSLPGELTYGARRVAELVRSMAGRPGVVLLDEPMAGLSTEQVDQVESFVSQMRAQGKAVLLVEHRMESVFGLCDRVLVLDRGHLVAAGTPAEVAADPLVREVYLGKGNSRVDSARIAGPTDADLLEVEQLTAGYGESTILHDLDLRVGAGEVVCVLGPNAAGKSTLLRAITGVARVVSGRIKLAGADLSNLPVEARIAMGLAIVPEGRRLFPSLTVRDHLLLGAEASLRPATARRREQIDERISAVLDLFPHLKPRLEQAAGTLSGGEQQMVALGRALASRPSSFCSTSHAWGLPRHWRSTSLRRYAISHAPADTSGLWRTACRAKRGTGAGHLRPGVRHAGWTDCARRPGGGPARY